MGLRVRVRLRVHVVLANRNPNPNPNPGFQAALAVGRAKERHAFAPEMISLVKRNSCGKVHHLVRSK